MVLAGLASGGTRFVVHIQSDTFVAECHQPDFSVDVNRDSRSATSRPGLAHPVFGSVHCRQTGSGHGTMQSFSGSLRNRTGMFNPGSGHTVTTAGTSHHLSTTSVAGFAIGQLDFQRLFAALQICSSCE